MITFNTLRHWILSVGITTLVWSGSAQAHAASPFISDETYSNLPFQMAKVQQPSFPDYSRTITEFGAVADGITLNTEAFAQAIEAVSQKGGGTVIVPAGLWLTGPIVLKSNINLHLEENALVLFTADHTQYPIINTSFEGLETRRCQSPISANGAENIAITGKGIMDGNGDTWRPVKKNKMTSTQWKRLVASGGVLNEKGDIWYPSEGARDGLGRVGERLPIQAHRHGAHGTGHADGQRGQAITQTHRKSPILLMPKASAQTRPAASAAAPTRSNASGA